VSHRISIVVPVRDGARYLPAALASLFQQTLPPDEVIVVDDGSTDGSAAIAEAIGGVRVIRSSARGPAAARNVGVLAASGDLIGFLDADDAATVDRLDLQVGALRRTASSDGAVGLAVNVPDRSEDIPDRSRARLPVRSFALGSLLLRRAAFDAVGLFDEQLVAAEGVDWVARARRAGFRWATLDEIVLLRRDHGANFSGSERSRDGYLQLARAAIIRQREAAE
jgi:glycosyltransferase involved in cell wall biosynthesis